MTLDQVGGMYGRGLKLGFMWLVNLLVEQPGTQIS
jgi:hypothetical protein